MAQADNTYSRVVGWLKIILPLIALGMLSSIFLVSRSLDPNATLPYSKVELEDRLRDPRLTTPRFSGMSTNGATITLDAAEMRPDLLHPGSGTATDLRATMITPDHAVTTLASDTGRIDADSSTYEMTGTVVITSSAGYRITAPRLTGSLDASTLDATGSVQADAPMGTITSDTMQLRADPANPGRYVLVFKDSVRLIYDPSN